VAGETIPLKVFLGTAWRSRARGGGGGLRRRCLHRESERDGESRSSIDRGLLPLRGAGSATPKARRAAPSDEDRARDKVTEAFEVAYAGAGTGEKRLSRIDDSEGLEELRQQVLVHFPLTPLDDLRVRVERVRFLNRKTAAVRYTIVLPGYSIPEFPNRIGHAVLAGNTWKVTRQTVCNDLTLGSVSCPRET